jgi:hypothetical protein
MTDLRSRPAWAVRLTSLTVLLVSALHCGNSEQGRRGDSSAGASGAGASMPDADAGTYGGSGSGGFDGGAGAGGSAGAIPINPPSGSFDGGACESYPAPFLRPECPEAPQPGEPCEPRGLPCLYASSDGSACFQLAECSQAGWSERTVCREGTSQPANDERCPERGPVDGEPCEHPELVCDFGPCNHYGTLVMQCECGRWKTLEACVLL